MRHNIVSLKLKYNHGTTEYRGIFSRYLPWSKITGTAQHYYSRWTHKTKTVTIRYNLKHKALILFRSGQVYFFNSRIKYTAKLHNTKLYSEIYTVTHNKFIQ